MQILFTIITKLTKLENKLWRKNYLCINLLGTELGNPEFIG